MKVKTLLSICSFHVLIVLILLFVPPFYPFDNKTGAYAYTYDVYAPVYMSYEEFRTPVTSSSEQPGVHVIHNQYPSNPEVIGFINIPGNVDIAIRDNILYADSWIDLVVIDISDPTNVSEIKRIAGIFPNTGPTFMIKEELEPDAYFERIDDNKGIVVDWEFVGTESYSHGCFPAGTEVLTANGPRAIETVKPGTKVYACDLTSGKWILSAVWAQRAYNYEGDMVTIHMDSTIIQTTGNHPFYVQRGNRLASRLFGRGLESGGTLRRFFPIRITCS